MIFQCTNLGKYYDTSDKIASTQAFVKYTFLIIKMIFSLIIKILGERQRISYYENI